MKQLLLIFLIAHYSAASQTISIVFKQAALTRGPYLNSVLQNSITIRWRTDIATDSKVNFGMVQGKLADSVISKSLTTDHIIILSGLLINTKYYYSIGSTTQTLQGDANNHFRTMPPVGSPQKVRVLAMGDMGNNSVNQVKVRNAYLQSNDREYTDVWLLLGDNAYQSGTDEEYQHNFFNIYQDNLTRNHVLWPAPGNHDYANISRRPDHFIPYYDIFSLPKNGEAGGVPSGTEAYYSFNYGNIHFVSLDSYGLESDNSRLFDTTGPQVSWLKKDLAANTQKWTVVYFHHPPYTMGSHNSDREFELIKIREHLVNILERNRVDLVLGGHSHSYERSYLINGHYGLENTFSKKAHALSSSTGKYNRSSNSCPYIKDAPSSRNGIVYVVAGSAGKVGGRQSTYPHNAMVYSNVNRGGVFFFEIENNRLDAKWINADGMTRDRFTIMKDVNKSTDIQVQPGISATLSASWKGDYKWSTGETTSSLSITPKASTSYKVSDKTGCLVDHFHVIVTGTK